MRRGRWGVTLWHCPLPSTRTLPFSPADAALGPDSEGEPWFLTSPLAAPYVFSSLHPLSLSSSCSSSERGRDEVLLD